MGHLEFSSGFAFIVLLVPDNTAGEVCERDLERVLKAQGKHLERAPTESPRELQNLPQWLLDRDGHSDVSAIWVKEITTQPFSGAPPAEKVIFASWEHAWKEAISRLNERRDTMKSRYVCPIIFVGAPWLKVLRGRIPHRPQAQSWQSRSGSRHSPKASGTYAFEPRCQ